MTVSPEMTSLDDVSEDTTQTIMPEDVTLNFQVRAHQKYIPIVNGIFRYCGWSIIIVAFVGNLLAVITLTSKHSKKTGTVFLMICMALADICTVLTYLLPQVMRIYNVYVMASHTVSCKVFYFIQTVAGQISAWTLVLITAERCIVVLRPLHVHSISTYKRVVIVWLVVTLTLSSLSLPILLDHDVSYSNIMQRQFCQYSEERLWVYVQWNMTVLKVFAPSALILIGACIIISTLIHGYLYRQTLKMSKTATDSNYERSVTLMLTINAIAYLALTSPKAVYAYFILPDDSADIVKSYDDWIIPVIYIVTDQLHQANHAVNFFLYLVTGQHFRRAFLAVIIPKRCRRKTANKTPGAAPLSTFFSEETRTDTF